MKYTKQIITGELLFIFIILSFIAFSQSSGISITGFQVANSTTQDSIRQELETTLPELDFIKETKDATLCLIVRVNPILSYSYDIVKLGDALVVVNSDSEFCKGISQEDFIISYVSYEKLKADLSGKPSLNYLKTVSGGQSFYVYPSKQILSGMKVANQAEFDQKYGNILNKYFTSDEITSFVSSGSETRVPSSTVMGILYIVAGALILVIAISLVLISLSKKPTIMEDLELVSYVKSMLAQGYQEYQIRQTLVDNGWKPENVEQAFKTAKTDVSVPKNYS